VIIGVRYSTRRMRRIRPGVATSAARSRQYRSSMPTELKPIKVVQDDVSNPLAQIGVEYYSDEPHDPNFPPRSLSTWHDYEEVVNGVRLKSLD
jgi:hypothetical protein